MGAGRSRGQRWQGSPSHLRVVTFIHTCMRAKLLQLCLTLCDPMDCSLPGSSVHGLSRQAYCSGLPCPSPGHISDPGIEPKSLMSASLAGSSLPLALPGKPIYLYIEIYVLVMSCSLWDLSSLTRVRLGAPEVEAWSPNH